MSSDHPEIQDFLRIAGSDGSTEAAKTDSGRFMRHLLAGCEPCQEGARQWWSKGIPNGSTGAYSKAFETPTRQVLAAAKRVHRENRDAESLVQTLLAEPRHRQELLAETDPRFQTLSVAEELLETSRQIRVDWLQSALQMVYLALLIADRLGSPHYPTAVVEDLKCRAHAEKGNIQRIQGEIRGASESFSRARHHMELGTGDPLVRARLLSFEASVDTERGEFLLALEKLRVVASIYRRFEDFHQVGRTLVQAGMAKGFLEDYEAAIRLLTLGLQRIEAEREPRLVLIARHNLVHYLNEAGRTRQAQALLQRTRHMYEDMGDSQSLSFMHWLEGKIALALGDLDEAENFLIKARDGLLAEGIYVEATCVCLDLARILVLENRTVELHKLAQEMIPIFESRDLRMRALEAFALFRKAVERDALTLGLVTDLARNLRREQGRNPLRR